MAATPVVLLITLSSHNSPPQASLFHITMASSLSFFLFLTFSILIFTLYTILKNYTNSNVGKRDGSSIKIQSLSANDGEKIAQQQKQEAGCEPDPGDLSRSLLLEILPSSSPKWDSVFSKGGGIDEDPGEKIGPGQEDKKRKKKRARKKKPGPNEEERKDKEELVCLYPFTKSCSATQRKIKQQYDQLVKSHGSNGLTLDQIGQFVNCLVDARNELQSKSEVIKRRFTITKALLFKADRSSFDRLRQQIYKLELEQKRLEEDAFVYNWLQEQLKVSPAYKKMLEISACMEMKAKSSSLAESQDASFSDISFEELLAQEKKDAFWQRNGKLRPCSG
ncbi:CA-responsive protein [Perilla frutescens var. hirtella]|uniref:CA-responsive protein n=1 Tax=Perilla frutescens var. hirtella TaxID=608512 RepID=A0AAD4JBI1_PERFH|nr:CA-responsive protein [Perilla frutescens var. frutescens]KAH6793215.1 CA-responsive protein [Perilla frutescens var. hirtella]KAH6830765.1 CA-responsive protein [Perilla frutescens var. hirtella]